MITDFVKITQGVFVGIGEFFRWKFLPSFVVPIIGVFFGWDNTAVLQALLILICFDFITGLIGAHISGEQIKSKMAVRSAFKIAVYGLLVSAGHLTEQVTPGSTFIEDAITTFLAITELISIIENAGKMGFAIPRKLLNQLHKLRDEDVLVRENKTVHVVHDPVAQTIETHTVAEKVTESHVVEKNNPPQG